MHKAGEEGDEYYPADDWKEVLVDIRNGVTQNVSEHRKTGDPHDSADDVVELECFVVHPSNAGKDRREGADNRKEPREKNRSPAVLCKECLRFFKMLFMEQE